MQTQVFRVQGMSCEHCRRAVVMALLDVPGVRQAEVDAVHGQARVEADDSVQIHDLVRAVAEVGYELQP
ncbi:MAG: cation transporter [Alicyclobacillus sp.]|nr:cation transporter [Alicyclobacillus sp.]